MKITMVQKIQDGIPDTNDLFIDEPGDAEGLFTKLCQDNNPTGIFFEDDEMECILDDGFCDFGNGTVIAISTHIKA